MLDEFQGLTVDIPTTDTKLTLTTEITKRYIDLLQQAPRIVSTISALCIGDGLPRDWPLRPNVLPIRR